MLPRLYAIADTATMERRGFAAAPTVEAWLEAGVRLIQYRHKGHFSRDRFAEAGTLAELCRQAGATFVIDDRADIAALLGAGVHVGQEDLSPADCRRVLGPHAIVGFSTHNETQLALAESAEDSKPATYLAIGPIFATSSKENPDPVVGLERIGALRALTAKPLVAIGGIRQETAGELIRKGIDSIAVISDLLPTSPEGVRARAEQWLRVLNGVV